MTGQELINYIEEKSLKEKHIFIDVQGYFSPIQLISETEMGDIVLSEEGRVANDWKEDCYNRERYFSEWFDILSYEKAEKMWEEGNKSFLILRNDGTDCYADCFASWDEITSLYPDALFGAEKQDESYPEIHHIDNVKVSESKGIQKNVFANQKKEKKL